MNLSDDKRWITVTRQLLVEVNWSSIVPSSRGAMPHLDATFQEVVCTLLSLLKDMDTAEFTAKDVYKQLYALTTGKKRTAILDTLIFAAALQRHLLTYATWMGFLKSRGRGTYQTTPLLSRFLTAVESAMQAAIPQVLREMIQTA